MLSQLINKVQSTNPHHCYAPIAISLPNCIAETHMKLCLKSIPVSVQTLLYQSCHSLFHGGSRDLSVATHQRLQHSIVNERILILQGREK